ncbi:MAG: hypothetical protein WA083_06370 [Candidatus Moraniibacteriota bacterium]
MKKLKVIFFSLVIFFISGYILNFMPVIKSNTCGCVNSGMHYVSLNYLISCFCSASNGDDFPGFFKNEFVVYFLFVLPFIFLVSGIRFLNKIIK